MKREKKSDISLLLIILVLFSASIGLLHGFKFSLLTASDQAERLSLSEQDALDMISSFLSSDNMVLTADAFQQFDAKTQMNLLQKILKGDGVVLIDEQKVKLLGSLGVLQNDAAKKSELMALLSTHFPNQPVLSLIVYEKPEFIGSLKKWAKKENKKGIFNKWKTLSVIEALKMDNVPLLTELYTRGVRLTPQEALLFLDRVVTEKRDIGFVPLLIKKFGADSNASLDGRYTPLMKAVQSNNPAMVQVLIDEGASPDLKLHPEIGSAKQLAAEKKGLRAIDKILTGY